MKGEIMRYIDAEALYKKIFPFDLVDQKLYTINAKAVANAIDNAPTADVAPKSEVANEVIDDIEMYVLGIKSGKEVIEKTTPKIYRLKRKDYMEAVLEYLAELKKKYTGRKE